MKRLFVFITFLMIVFSNYGEDICNCYGVLYQGGLLKDHFTGSYCYADTQSGPDELCGPMFDCRLGFTGCDEAFCYQPCYSHFYEED